MQNQKKREQLYTAPTGHGTMYRVIIIKYAVFIELKDDDEEEEAKMAVFERNYSVVFIFIFLYTTHYDEQLFANTHTHTLHREHFFILSRSILLLSFLIIMISYFKYACMIFPLSNTSLFVLPTATLHSTLSNVCLTVCNKKKHTACFTSI